jgi:hypothetical protein
VLVGAQFQRAISHHRVELYDLGIGLLSWGTNRWWKLTPDPLGNYANGSWTRLADSNVARTS